MRSDVYEPLMDAPPELQAPELQALPEVQEGTESLTDLRHHVLPKRRSFLFSKILADAALGAREYVERWVAGRGAE